MCKCSATAQPRRTQKKQIPSRAVGRAHKGQRGIQAEGSESYNPRQGTCKAIRWGLTSDQRGHRNRHSRPSEGGWVYGVAAGATGAIAGTRASVSRVVTPRGREPLVTIAQRRTHTLITFHMESEGAPVSINLLYVVIEIDLKSRVQTHPCPLIQTRSALLGTSKDCLHGIERHV